MGLVNVRLHENYVGEKIPSAEHDTVHSVMAEFGYSKYVFVDDVRCKLPPGDFFGERLTPDQVQLTHTRLRLLLKRPISVMFGTGAIYCYGLSPAPAPVDYSLLSKVLVAKPAPLPLGLPTLHAPFKL